MNKKTSLAAVIFFSAVVICGLAQDDPPKGRLVTGLSPGMAWKVEALPADQKTSISAEGTGTVRAPSDSTPKKIVLVEENVMGVNFRQQTTFARPGLRQTRLFQEGMFFIRSADGSSYSIDFPNEDLTGTMLNPKRMSEFDWVKAKWWTGTAVVDGVECDVYRRHWPPTHPDDDMNPPAADASTQFAAIGRADGFPRRLGTPYRVLRYTPLSRVTPQQLPAGAEAVARDLREKLERQANRFRIPQ